jgi:signal recognition particle receptor subunit beta
MAVLDRQNGCVVIRVVYDGAPMAGKTTSVAALGRGLGAAVVSPAEFEGRTLFFDWLDYTGGLFEGHRIRCQIVSVPGQATLAPRRRRLLESADVVVFVGDSSPAGFAADQRYLAALSSVLHGLRGPPVGIVMQANKRDLPDAIPLEQLREMLEGMQVRIGIVESIATEGVGVREAFVFAVRLALDRVRELMRTGDLPNARPQIDSAEDLLGELQRAEAGALDLATASGLKHTSMQDVRETKPSLAASALHEAISDEARSIEISRPVDTNVVETNPVDTNPVDTNKDRAPWLPDERVASGMIWPPVDGRFILHDLAGLDAQVHRHAEGGWAGLIGERWQARSAPGASFATVEEGRAVLLQWARLHAASAGVLSKERCIALAPDGKGIFRLWQIVRVERSLRAEIEAMLHAETRLLVGTLLSAIGLFFQMAECLSAAGYDLPLSLGNISESASRPVYSGLMPDVSTIRAARRWSYAHASYQLFGELSFAEQVLRARRDDLLDELGTFSRSSEKRAQGEWSLLRRLVVAQTYG